MPFLMLCLAALCAFDDAPGDVLDFFRSAAAELLDAHDHGDARAFLEYFDPDMPGYEKFRGQIEAMVAADEVRTTIEFVSDEGGDRKRTFELDWLLSAGNNPPKRGIVKCTIERRGKKWKITALDPIEFFRLP